MTSIFPPRWCWKSFALMPSRILDGYFLKTSVRAGQKESLGRLLRAPKAMDSLGDSPLAPKAIELCLCRTVQSRCLRLVRRAPSLYGATEGSANEAADVRLESFGLSRGLSAAAESAFPEGAMASILRGASGGKRASKSILAYARWAFFSGLGEP